MRVDEMIASARRPLFTYELLPPLKGHVLDTLYRAVETLQEFEPAYVNVTCHQQESVYIERPDGLIERRVVHKRPGTVAMSAALKYRFGIEVVPHVICGGVSRESIENELIDLNFLGIENVLALRGDPPRGERKFAPVKDGYEHTDQLVGQIARLREGHYLDPELKNTHAMDFCVGVAGYPEKHAEAPNIESDIAMLKQKVDAGAHYIVTQMFFLNDRYREFVNRCRAVGITVPIIPGIKPLSALTDVRLIPQIFSIDIPEELVAAVSSCTTNAQVREVGVEFAVSQSKDLIASGAPGIHYYTLGMADNIAQIVRRVF